MTKTKDLTGYGLTNAVRNIEGLSPRDKSVFVALASYAKHSKNSAGKGAYPKIATLAKNTGYCPESVIRALTSLKAKGLIRLGDQSLVAKYPPGRKPKVYDIDLDVLASWGEIPTIADTGTDPYAGMADLPAF